MVEAVEREDLFDLKVLVLLALSDERTLATSQSDCKLNPVIRDGQDHHLLVPLKIKIRSSKKCDLEDQRLDHPHTVILKIKIKIVILKIKITLLLILKEK